MNAESDFSDAFRNLLLEEEIANPESFQSVAVVSEVPIYSRFSQLSFLDGLTVAEKNRRLILAALDQLERVYDYLGDVGGQGGAEIVRMVAITDWEVEQDGVWRCDSGTGSIITPHLWIGNLAHPDMADFKVHLPRSECSAFVAERVDAARYEVFESQVGEVLPECPERVYVARIAQVSVLPVAI